MISRFNFFLSEIPFSKEGGVMDWRIVVSVDLAPAILRKEFQWSVEIPLLSTTLPSPKVRKRDLREKKREENHFSAEREPDIHTP